jgi:predicted Zn-dependent protease
MLTRVRALAALLLLIGLAGCSTVPVTGRKTFSLIPESQSIALGADAYQQVLADAQLVTSGPDYDMVLRVGRRIAAVSDRPDYAWEFSLIRDDQTVNAFCLPGGKVAVYTGILPVAGSDAGLATVLSHEIAHAIAQHGSERMTDDLAIQIGGMGLQALLSGKSEATQQLVLTAYGVGGQVGMLLPFSRSQESEADHIGLIYMARAGYDPHEAVKFWQRMESQAGGARPPEFLSTHPNPDKRVQDLEHWMPEAVAEYQKR